MTVAAVDKFEGGDIIAVLPGGALVSHFPSTGLVFRAPGLRR